MAESNHAGRAPKRLGVREFRGNLSDVLRQARNGRSFVITSRDEVLAELHPPSASVRLPRAAGTLRGRIRMSPDFDTLPSDVLAAMEGEGA